MIFLGPKRSQCLARAVSGEALPIEQLETHCPENGMILANCSSIGMEPYVYLTPFSKIIYFARVSKRNRPPVKFYNQDLEERETQTKEKNNRAGEKKKNSSNDNKGVMVVSTRTDDDSTTESTSINNVTVLNTSSLGGHIPDVDVRDGIRFEWNTYVEVLANSPSLPLTMLDVQLKNTSEIGIEHKGNPEAMKLILENISDQESHGEGEKESQDQDDKPVKAIAKEEAPSKSAKIQLFPETPTDTKKQPTPIAKAEATGTQLSETETQRQ
nr:bifunctional 3-dehydroquinate dehydratase/shikimate dehydrogenase, chloroplastic-like [Tanacetum cinerariifolium]